MKCRAITISMPISMPILMARASGQPQEHPFPTAQGRTGLLSDRPMTQSDAYRMIRRRAAEAGIATKIGNHSFRATGITEYLRTCAMVARSKLHSKWLIMDQPVPQASMTGARMN